MSKKVIFIGAAVIGVVLIAVAIGAGILLGQQSANNANMANNNPQFTGGGRNNFQQQQGKIVSVESKSFVLDGETAQLIVSWNDQTQIRKTVTVDKSMVLTVGNSILARLDSSSKATTVSKFEQPVMSGPASSMMVPFDGSNRPQGNSMRGGDTNGGNRVQFMGGQNMVAGEITEVSDTKIKVKTLAGEEREVDISNARFTETTNATSADFTAGMSVQVTGAISNEKLTARQITIQ